MIECILYMFIFIILICTTWILSINVYKKFISLSDCNYNESIEESKITNSFIVIKKMCNSNVSKVNYYEDKIIIYHKEENGAFKITKIEISDSKLVAAHYSNELDFENNSKSTCNYILNDVREIHFYKKRKIVYMKIITKDNKEFIQCI